MIVDLHRRCELNDGGETLMGKALREYTGRTCKQRIQAVLLKSLVVVRIEKWRDSWISLSGQGRISLSLCLFLSQGEILQCVSMLL